ncbi:MAG: RHS repeat-associated core domain-containing protein [Fimbriimonadaceae bacterium]
MSARVSNIGGRIVGEKRNGSYRSHQHDALGNTIALINDAGVVTDTYTFWPYGELRTSTGTTTNPFKFCGAWGYYTDTTGRTYVRARTLRPGLCRWMTVDPLWPFRLPYTYVAASPASRSDRFGLDQDPMPGKDVCFSGPPKIEVRHKFEDCSEPADDGEYAVRIGLDIKATCKFHSFGSYWHRTQYDIPQWVTTTTNGIANPTRMDGNLWFNCRNAKPNRVERGCNRIGICTVETWGVDSPGSLADPPINQPQYPRDCSAYEPWTVRTRRPIGYSLSADFETCCSCYPVDYYSKKAPQTPLQDLKKNCTRWRMSFSFTGPGKCPVNFELLP